MFRSEEMGYYNLILSRESAWHTINQIGSIDSVHFEDMQSDVGNFNRPYYNQVKRCEELLLKVKFIKEKMKFFGRPIEQCKDVPQFLQYMDKFLQERPGSEQNYLQEVEEFINSKFSHLEDQLQNYQSIMEQKISHYEYKNVIEQSQILLKNQMNQQQQHDDLQKPLTGADSFGLSCLYGVLNTDDILRFQRMIFRVTKGNVICLFSEIKDDKQMVDPLTKEKLKKSVFVLLFSGGQYQILEQKLNKVCDSLNARRYEVPKQESELLKKKHEINKTITDQEEIEKLTLDNLYSLLDQFTFFRDKDSLCSLIEEHQLFIQKDKNIYQIMNLLKQENAIYYVYCWIPKKYEEKVMSQLQKVGKDVMCGQIRERVPQAVNVPPTYFRLNEVTAAFQEIVDIYGVPRYKEINPGLFNVCSFPFIFAVMFGDIFHGFLLFMFGLFLVMFHKQVSSLKLLGPYRYLIFLMGMFAFYTGWIYNDFSSIQLDTFGSCYNIENDTVTKTQDCTYTFGLDPIWSISENEIAFQNSMKMKLAVIIGVAQMSLGICMKGLNSLYFKKYLDFFFEFIPQLVFMLGLFGYMNFMIIYKWLTHYDDPAKAPGLIQALITIPLSMCLGQPRGPDLWGAPDQQKNFEEFIFFLALICIPWMLIPKPLLEIRAIKAKSNSPQNYNNLVESKEDQEKNNKEQKQEDDHDHEHDSGEIVVHQAIETIEFVLGSISNTASYLRLWALSLAHSQLAKVFFEKTLKMGLEDGGSFIMLVIGFQIFFVLTFGVLMMMDVMECLLHAVRLHWVEFQNKFYKADGYLFQPFSLQKALNSVDVE